MLLIPDFVHYELSGSWKAGIIIYILPKAPGLSHLYSHTPPMLNRINAQMLTIKTSPSSNMAHPVMKAADNLLDRLGLKGLRLSWFTLFS
jgi:hypothetical protein